MLNCNIYNEKIFYYKNIIKNTQDFINFFESTENDVDEKNGVSKWKVWKTNEDSPYIYGEKKIIDESKILNSNKGKEIYLTIIDAISFCIKDYENKTNSKVGKLQSFGISKYYTNKEMGPHVDFNIFDNIKLIPTISLILYLNDDYEGGELYFPKQNINIKPESGSLIIFPSIKPFYHSSKKTTIGNKYIIPMFCYNQEQDDII